MNPRLFRPEVLARREQSALGTIVLVRPLSWPPSQRNRCSLTGGQNVGPGRARKRLPGQTFTFNAARGIAVAHYRAYVAGVRFVLIASTAALLLCIQSPVRSEAPNKGAALPLWRAISARATIHIVPTIHYATKDVYPLPRPIYDALQSSTALAVEVDDSKPAEREQIQRLVAYPAGRSLADEVDSKTLDRLVSLFAGLGVDRERVLTLRPIVIMSALAQAQFTKAGFKPEEGVDRHLIAFAQRSGVPIVGLESAADQIRPYETLTVEENSAMLSGALRRFERGELAREIRDIVAAWRVGDLDGIERIVRERMYTEPILERVSDKTIRSRNEAMFRKVEELAQRNPRLTVAIGAAHVYGPRGLLAWLKARGYAVQQETQRSS